MLETRRFAAAVFLVTAFLAGPAFTQDCVDWTETLQVAAPIGLLMDATDVAMAGGTGLVVAGTNLTIYDLSDPDAPVQFGNLPLGGTGTVVASAGGLAAVAVADHVLLVDWHDPAAPVQVADLTLPAAVSALALDAGRLAVGCGVVGLYVFDVTVPNAPAAGGSLALFSDLLDLSFGGDLLLVAAYTEVVAVDLSDLAAPAVASTWNQNVEYSGTPYFLQVAHLGDHAAVLSDQFFWMYTDEWGVPHFGRDTAVITLDLASDGTMSLAGYERATGVAMAAAGSSAYVAGEAGVHILDVPAGAPPEFRFTMPEFAAGDIVAAADNHVLLPQPGRIEVLDTTYSAFVPALLNYGGTSVAGHFLLQSSIYENGNWIEWSYAVSDLSTPGVLTPVYSDADGDFNAYRTFSILRAWPGRLIFQGFSGEGWGTSTTYADIRSGTPLIHQFGAGNEIRDAHAAGDRLYLELGSGRSIRDASQPETLPEIATFDVTWSLPMETTPDDPSEVVVTGGDGLLVLDWTDAATPLTIGACPIAAVGHPVAVTATRAYVMAGSSHLVCVDIADPAAPTVLWEAAEWGDGSRETLQVRGDLGLVETEYGLLFLDLSSPDGPVQIGQPFGGGRGWVAWVDDEVYFNDDEVLSAWDVSNPAAPVHLGRANELGYRVTCFEGQVATTSGTYPRHCQVTAIEDPDDGGDLPPAPGFALRVAPNPFNPQTTVSFELAAAGPVRLALYDLTGRRVRTLVDERRASGPHAVLWDGRDDRGRGQSSGVYIARLETERRVLNLKLVLVR